MAFSLTRSFSIWANPGAAIATTAVALWVVAAVSVLLLTFVGSNAAHAQASHPTAGTSLSRPAATPSSARGRAFAGTRPSSAVSRPATHGPSPVQPPQPYSPTLSPTLSSSPHVSPSPSSSLKVSGIDVEAS